jgi:hypothetical protein
MAQFDISLPPKPPWNTGWIIGPKPPFKPKHIWGIRQQLKARSGSALGWSQRMKQPYGALCGQFLAPWFAWRSGCVR